MPVEPGKQSFLESDGKSVNVQIVSAVALEKDQAVYVQGWLGITNASGNSGDYISLTIDRREYQFSVPSGLTVNAGDTVYVTIASVVAHVIPDAAYSTSSGVGKTALFKATAAKDANNVVTGILLPEGV